MHDLLFAERIIKYLKDNVTDLGAERKITVEVGLSIFSHVSPESLRAAFSTLVERQGFRNIEISVAMTRPTMVCKKCSQETELAQPIFSCPKCQSTEFDIVNSEEFSIRSFKIDSK